MKIYCNGDLSSSSKFIHVQSIKKLKGPSILVDGTNLSSNELVELEERFPFDLFIRNVCDKHFTYALSGHGMKLPSESLCPLKYNSETKLVDLNELGRTSKFVDPIKRLPVCYIPSGKERTIEDVFCVEFSEQRFGLFCPFLPLDTSIKTLLLDRDGVINVDHGYVSRWEDFEYTSFGLEAFSLAKKYNWQVFVLTNQSGIARGYYSYDDVIRLHNVVDADLEKRGYKTPKWFFSPFHPNGSGEFQGISYTRKPWPGMVFKAFGELGLDPHRCAMVGDKPSDRLLIPDLKFFGILGKYSFAAGDRDVYSSFEELKDALICHFGQMK